MKTIRAASLAALALCAAQTVAAKRIDVTFSGYSGTDALADFPALVRLSTEIEGFSYADFTQADGGDLRFVDVAGNLLAHEIDTWDTNGVSTVWVKVPSLTASTTITAKYGSSAPPVARNASEVWSSGYVGVWHLGESARPLRDSSANGLHFARSSRTVGKPAEYDACNTYGAGDSVVGRAVKIDPTVSGKEKKGGLYADDPDSLIGGFSAMTVEIWAKSVGEEAEARSQTLFSKRQYNSPKKNIATIWYNTAYKPISSFEFQADGVTNLLQTTGSALDEDARGQWKYHVVSFDKANTVHTNYLNAAVSIRKTQSLASWGDHLSTDDGLCLGNRPTPGNLEGFNGFLDELRISNVARSPAWVKATYDTIVNPGFASYSEAMDGIPKVFDVFGTATNVYAEIDKKGASALAIRGNTLFCGSGDLLYILDVSNPLAPRFVSKLPGFSQLRQIAVEGDLLGISSRGGGAWLVDVSDISAPRILSHIDTVEQATGMEIAGNFMAIGQRSTGVELIDITDRTRPQHICLVETQESQSCRYQNGILYSGDWHSGQVNLIDVTDISKASIIGTTLMHGYGDGFDIDGDYIYASTGHHRITRDGETVTDKTGLGHGLEIWNRSDPSNVVFVSRVEFPKFYRQGNDWWQCCESGGWVFCSDTHNGVFAVDARDPEEAYVSDRFVDFNPKDPDAPSRCINSIAVGNGAVYATSGGGLWVIPCEYARYRAEYRGTELTQENLSWRDPYTTPTNSHFTAWIPPARGPVHSAAAYGGCYYAGCSYAGAYVIDARTLKTLRKIPCAYARDVYVRDGKLYIAQGDEGLGIYSLDDPANPVEERRITKLTDKLSHFEWVYVPNSRWAVCHARRNSGNWYFIDLSKNPAETVSYVMSTNLTKKIAGVSGMDWVRPFSDELVRGKWLGYARTHGFFMWFDMSGDRPVCYDTTDTTSAIANSSSRPNYIKTSSCCTPISDEKILVSNSGSFFILDPDLDRDPKVESWPTFIYSNCSKPVPNGMSSWDGKTHVGLAAQQARTVQMADISDPEHPILEWHESTIGCPENGVFDADGLFLVPCGYQGLLVQKRFEPEVPVPAPDSFAHSFDVNFAGYAGAETLTDFPVLVRLSSAIEDFSYSGFALPNGGDLRFFDAKGNLLSHEIDTWNENGESTVWVKIPSLNTTTTIKAAYGCAAPPANNPSDVWSNGYVGVWHLDEDGFVQSDSTANSKSQSGAEASHMEARVAGAVGKGMAMATQSPSAYKGGLSTSDSGDLYSNTKTLTLEMWCCHQEIITDKYIFAKKGKGNAYTARFSWPLYNGDDTKIQLNYSVVMTNLATRTGKSYGDVKFAIATNEVLNAWMHYALVVDNATLHRLEGYQNGMTKKTQSISDADQTVCAVGGNFAIGNSSASGTQAFPGSIDEVRVSNVARSADWVKATYDTVMKTNFASYATVGAPVEGYAAWAGSMGIPGDPGQRHNGIAKGIRYAFDIAPAYGPHEIGTPILDIGPGSDGAVSVKLRPLAENRSDVAYGVLATESLDDWEHATFVPYSDFTNGTLTPAKVKDPAPSQMFFKYKIDIQQ